MRRALLAPDAGEERRDLGIVGEVAGDGDAVPAERGPITVGVALDARRREVYHARYRREVDGEILRIAEPAVDAPAEVADVTGAGDAALGAFCHALVLGAGPVEAARYGHAAAALTVASEHTVRPDLTDALVRTLLDAEEPA